MAFPKIDLSQLAAPNIVEPLSFDVILAAMIADLQARDSTFTALVESDPAYKIMEVCAYRELLIRQRVNEAAKGVMLAYAAGTDLDQLGANMGITRNVITPANPNAFPPTAAVMESDSDFRARIQLAPEALSVAGPVGAYIFWAKTVADVLDVSVVSPTPGAVVVTLLSRSGSGIPSQATIDAVTAALADVRPLTDQLTVQAATLVNYAISASVTTFDGPDSATVIAACQSAVQAYVASSFKLGRTISISGIYAALQQPGVDFVTLSPLVDGQPLGNVTVTDAQAAFCTEITLTNGGVAQ